MGEGRRPDARPGSAGPGIAHGQAGGPLSGTDGTGGTGPARVLRVGDLVEVAPVRPVIRLADLAEPSLREDLVRGFVLTEDARHVLATVLGDVAVGRGRGYVLEGHYGAGKSHLLAVLHELAAGGFREEELGAGLRAGASASWRAPRRDGRPLAVSVSLLEHAARQPLDAIVLRALARRLGDGPVGEEASATRGEVWGSALERARSRGFSGVLLCMDELGEFLAAKPDARSFAEDVRFLQFLGEWAGRGPAWIVLGVQEALDQAGDLPAAVSGGLRDRYAVRFRLGAGHIRELVAGRLVRPRPGAGSEIDHLSREFVRLYGTPPGGLEALTRLYPVHPVTIDLLDRLRPLFSQRRGVVDFVTARLAGDPARQITPWLQRPADRLLGPDRLLDHFRDRIRERPETAPLVDRALDYFERDLPRQFRDAELGGVARRLGKILIAGALCPTPMSFTVQELTMALAHRFSGLEPAVNREFVADLAERMVASGAYVGRSEEPATEGGGTARRYRCDLQADIRPVLRHRVSTQRRGLSLADGRLWAALQPIVDDPAFPLARLAQHPQASWEIAWRHAARHVFCRVTPPDALTRAAVALWTAELDNRAEADALLVVVWGAAEAAEAAVRAGGTGLGTETGLPVLIWMPRPVRPGEAEALLELAAQVRVEVQVEGDFTGVGRRLREHLQAGRAELRRRVSALVRDLYLQGRVVAGDGVSRRPAELGSESFIALLARLFDGPFGRRYPAHPMFGALSARTPEAALVSAVTCLARGVDPGPAGSPEEQAVTGLLAPLGVCRRDARGWRLADGEEAGPHAAALVALLEGSDREHPVPVPSAYARLRKGPGGLGRLAFGTLCFAMARLGEVSVRRRGRRLAADQVTPERIWDADGLFRGALLDRELRPVWRELPMLPLDLRSRAVSHGSQRAAWQALCAWRRAWGSALPEVRAQAARALRLPATAALVGPEGLPALDALEELLPAVTPSLSAEEGLARFCRAMADRPGAVHAVREADELRSRLSERLDALSHMAAYLDAPECTEVGADLAETAHGLRRRLQGPEPSTRGDWEELCREFAAFRSAYARAYQAQHAASVGPQGLAEYRAVLDSPEMRLARRLAVLRQPGHPDAEGVEASAAEALRLQCGIDPVELEERLLHVPSCRCGFIPGRPARMSPERLGELAREAARSALGTLRRPDVAGRWDRASAALGAQVASVMSRLRAVDPRADDAAERALACLGELGAAADEVIAAASGRPLAATLDLGDLQVALCTRPFTPAEVRGAVDRWLTGADGCPTIRIRPAPGALGWGPASAAAAWAETRAALRAAAEGPPRDAGEWGALWLGPAGCWQRRFAEFAAPERLTEADGVAAEEWARQVEQAFRSGDWAAPPRNGLGPVGQLLDRLAAEGRTVFAHCVDALRCDLLEALEQEVAAHPGLHVPERGVSWAVAPTVTAAQFDDWARQGWPVTLARQDGGSAAAIARMGREALDRVSWASGRCVCKWDFLDRRLHDWDGEFGFLAAEFRLQVQYLLLPALTCLRPGDVAVVFGDHGFRCRATASGWRYAHGGDSLDEVLTPWCVVECDPARLSGRPGA